MCNQCLADAERFRRAVDKVTKGVIWVTLLLLVVFGSMK